MVYINSTSISRSEYEKSLIHVQKRRKKYGKQLHNLRVSFWKQSSLQERTYLRGLSGIHKNLLLAVTISRHSNIDV